jgi:hypothetical protein
MTFGQQNTESEGACSNGLCFKSMVLTFDMQRCIPFQQIETTAVQRKIIGSWLKKTGEKRANRSSI